METEGLTWRTSLARKPVLQASDVVRHAACLPAERRRSLLAQAA
ncbi:MAG TPA: hypothetical protein VKR21_17575 [Solirubrobacteraceae bacterium]|nr:hypothetical protein [Solirubrobacteraceae bacterium]